MKNICGEFLEVKYFLGAMTIFLAFWCACVGYVLIVPSIDAFLAISCLSGGNFYGCGWRLRTHFWAMFGHGLMPTTPKSGIRHGRKRVTRRYSIRNLVSKCRHKLAEVSQETVTAKETAAITQLLQMVGCFYFLFEIGHNLFSDHLFYRGTHDGDCPQFTQESPEFWPWAKTPPVRDWLFPTPEKPEKLPMLCWSCCCCCWAAAACWAAALSACFLVCKKDGQSYFQNYQRLVFSATISLLYM